MSITYQTNSGHTIHEDNLILFTDADANHPDIDAPRIAKRVKSQLEGSIKGASIILAEIYESILPNTPPDLYLLRYLGINQAQAREMMGDDWQKSQHIRDIQNEEMARVHTRDNTTRYISFEHLIPAINAAYAGANDAHVTRRNLARIQHLKKIILHQLAAIVERRNNLKQHPKP